jgi:2-succinyl-5-enolpyruvyl-6-hydroxy-3-cyclohexene-1-carboxylate synthase
MNIPSTPSLDFRNTNSLWCSVLVETLARRGVRHAVISPGSRSAPLTFALARHPGVECLPVLDERSAGFYALGLAKQHRRPVALVCTSGTAAANFLPAVVEAHESGVPLILLTADRPAELRDCHSGQTIDQVKIYGGNVNHHHECAVPEATLPMLRYLRQTVAYALARSVDPMGPVHLNCPFRDPLPPLAEKVPLALAPSDFTGFFEGIEAMSPTQIFCGFGRPDPNKRGIIVAGPSECARGKDFAARVGRISRALGWPVLADALSPLRMHAAQSGHLVSHYDFLLRGEQHATELLPQQVLCLGGWPTSKVLRAWLQKADPEVVLLVDQPGNADSLHLRTKVVRAKWETWGWDLSGTRALPAYCKRWLRAEAQCARALTVGLKTAKGLIEPKWPGVLAANLPKRTPCFIASSMPVRDAEYFWPANNRGHAIFFNRGANGIDGTLSTALGVAHGGAPAVLVTGDLALLHDTNGFLSVPRFKGSLTIVLINNNGGGIFEHLPVAQFNPTFEEFFATPQKVDFATLSAAYGVGHVRVRDERHLAALVDRLPATGVRVLEVCTDRKHDASFRKQLFASVGR